ncbi:MAG: hypothetical protein HYV07_21340 [Deltaproteobacteria bacterium]|nr:hypothetical protein [Deltaproteobacteria bacterium]
MVRGLIAPLVVLSAGCLEQVSGLLPTSEDDRSALVVQSLDGVPHVSAIDRTSPPVRLFGRSGGTKVLWFRRTLAELRLTAGPLEVSQTRGSRGLPISRASRIIMSDDLAEWVETEDTSDLAPLKLMEPSCFSFTQKEVASEDLLSADVLYAESAGDGSVLMGLLGGPTVRTRESSDSFERLHEIELAAGGFVAGGYLWLSQGRGSMVRLGIPSFEVTALVATGTAARPFRSAGGRLLGDTVVAFGAGVGDERAHLYSYRVTEPLGPRPSVHVELLGTVDRGGHSDTRTLMLSEREAIFMTGVGRVFRYRDGALTEEPAVVAVGQPVEPALGAGVLDPDYGVVVAGRFVEEGPNKVRLLARSKDGARWAPFREVTALFDDAPTAIRELGLGFLIGTEGGALIQLNPDGEDCPELRFDGHIENVLQVDGAYAVVVGRHGWPPGRFTVSWLRPQE